MKKIRLFHRYMGLFFSPAILFFAFSGALQTFNLHESGKNSSYVPPRWVVVMAQIHKKQTLNVPPQKTRSKQPAAEARDSAPPKDASKPQKSSLSFKCFSLLMSVGLIVTTLLGIFMGFRYGTSRGLIWGLLIAGTLLPMAMLFL